MMANLYNINAFDSYTEMVFNFIWNGNQSFGNILQIRDNTDFIF